MMRASCSSSSCCCSLRSRLMAQTQGIRCGNGSLRGLASSSSSSVTASSSSSTLKTASGWARVHPVAAALPGGGGGDNKSTATGTSTCSGETVSVPLQVPPQRQPNIIVSPILSQLHPAASSYSAAAAKSSLLSEKWFASTAAYMSPALANPLVISPTPIRPFSTMGNPRFGASAPVLSANTATTTTTTPSAAPDTAAAAAAPQQQKFTYHISASFAAKQKRFSPTANIYNFNPYHRVQDSARRKSRPDAGQDAFFVSRINDSGAVAAGVADGVGGYAESGIDSADFSHTFCERMASAAYQATAEGVSAKQLIETGYRRILDEDAIAGGASTACVGVAKPDGQLNVANLGDSGFLIIRQGKIQYASSPQTHDFNTPYQLAMIPKKLLAQARQFGGGPFSDEPADAQVSTHALRNGDVVVFATDGVWDNLSIQDVLRIVTDEMQIGKGWVNNGDVGIIPAPNLGGVAGETDGRGIQAQVARAIATRAKSASVSTKLDGPFAKEVQRLFPGENFHGGKRDDICVVCMVVVEVKGPTTPKL